MTMYAMAAMIEELRDEVAQLKAKLAALRPPKSVVAALLQPITAKGTSHEQVANPSGSGYDGMVYSAQSL